MIDCHIHTNTSEDSKMTVMDACKQAVECGLKYICFTNHHEIPEMKNSNFNFSLDGNKFLDYKKAVEQARKEFPELKISFGCEIGHMEEYKDEIKEFLDEHDFDFVLGSIHWMVLPDGKADLVSDRAIASMEKHGRDAYMKVYARSIVESINSGLYDSISHIGMFTRFIPDFDFSNYDKELNDIVEAFKNSKTGIEINTWRGKFPKGYWNPPSTLVKAVFNTGNPILTVGSDAHETGSVGKGIKEVLQFAKTCGYEKVAFFEKRKPLFLDIDKLI